jgi:glycosyltransferase involved in cell wall biosynthesis
MHLLIEPLWQMIVRNSSAITSPSMFLKRLIQKSRDIPVDEIPNGFNLPTVQETVKENRILVVTRMFERKGVQFLLEALQDFPEGWDVQIIGDGPYLPELKKLAEKLDVNVEFKGQVPNDEIFGYYLKSKIYVFPSMVENFPVVLLEAMAAGCAVITTTAHGCAEVVGDSAIKVTPGSSEEIRKELLDLITDEQKMSELGDSGRQRVKDYAWPVVTEKFIKVFDRVKSSE